MYINTTIESSHNDDTIPFPTLQKEPLQLLLLKGQNLTSNLNLLILLKKFICVLEIY